MRTLDELAAASQDAMRDAARRAAALRRAAAAQAAADAAALATGALGPESEDPNTGEAAIEALRGKSPAGAEAAGGDQGPAFGG